jgi:DNA-binding CsgD family transcriptional regulator
MLLWQRFIRYIDRRIPAEDASLLRSLRDLAAREQRPADEVINSLLNQALQERQLAEEHWKRWQRLTPREQEVAALVCLNHTSRQIAAVLVISPETVKTHVGNLLRKFGLSTRQELRQALAGWDFGEWEKTCGKNKIK